MRIFLDFVTGYCSSERRYIFFSRSISSNICAIFGVSIASSSQDSSYKIGQRSAKGLLVPKHLVTQLLVKFTNRVDFRFLVKASASVAMELALGLGRVVSFADFSQHRMDVS